MFPGFPDPLWPFKLKNAILSGFWNFGQIKSMQMGKLKIAKLKSFRLAFQRSKFVGLDRALQSYGPGRVKTLKFCTDII